MNKINNIIRCFKNSIPASKGTEIENPFPNSTMIKFPIENYIRETALTLSLNPKLGPTPI